jgi:putative Holliday junction resolvase
MMDKTYIGIDFGERRIGLAKSDPTGLIASSLKTIQYKSINKAIDEIVGLINEHDAVGAVVGYPISLSGGDKGELCRMVDDFVEKLKRKYDGPIHLEDERFSSAEARAMIHAHGKKIGRDKGRVDRAAAAIILQSFLDNLQ